MTRCCLCFAGQLPWWRLQVSGRRHVVSGLDLPGWPRLLPVTATVAGGAVLTVLDAVTAAWRHTWAWQRWWRCHTAEQLWATGAVDDGGAGSSSGWRSDRRKEGGGVGSLATRTHNAVGQSGGSQHRRQSPWRSAGQTADLSKAQPL